MSLCTRTVLYITYDGLQDPLGQSQIWPYVRGLALQGHRFEVISFEKNPVGIRWREELMPGVRWTALRYHRKFAILSTLYDLSVGFWVASLLMLLNSIQIIHVRSYVPALLALPLSKIFRVPWIFDTRGLWPDEKVESGSWSQTGLVYRMFKHVEYLLFKKADHVVVLTRAFKKYLNGKTRSPISVISTCTDLNLFSMRDSYQWTPGMLIYVGSLGALYLTDDIVRFYKMWRKYAPNPKLCLITHSSVKLSLDDELILLKLNHAEVPAVIQKAQAAVCLIKPSFSKLASAPTKLGEFWACGLPVAANMIGDMQDLFSGTQAGVILSDLSDESLEAAAKKLFECSQNAEVRQEARALAEKYFGLEQAVQEYSQIYQTLCVV